MPNLVGQTLLDQFRVEKFIASGGMGTVYCVWDLKRNVPLAMKVLHGELAEDPSILKGFKREANALKKLTHPHIVPFYGLYQTADFAFLLERFIDGPSLKEVLRERNKQPLPFGEALVYMKALCAALGYAHANGVVHCDVKPGNVILDLGGNIYITDFGVARHAESSHTTFGNVGTPAYMAPEQMLGRIVTPATDLYALGVILYEMLTGQRLFRGEQTGNEKSGTTLNEKIRYAHLHTPPPNPGQINPHIPESLARTILKALDKEPGKRFLSAPDFFSAACQATGISPEQVGDRIILPSTPAEPVTVKRTGVTPIKPPVLSLPLPRKFRSVPVWQLAGIVLLALVFCLVTGMLMFQLPFLAPAPPTETGTITATLPPPATGTFTPLLSPSSTPAPEKYFTEEFDDLNQYWRNFVITDNESDQSISVSNGSLNIRITDDELWTYLIYQPETYNNVRIDVKLENKAENSGALIICNFTGRDWYEFRILSSGLYEIAYRSFDSDGKHASQARISNGGSTQINLGKATNKYGVTCMGNTLTLYINGELAQTVTPYRKGQVLTQGQGGIGLYSAKVQPVEVSIDQVKIGQP